jgi:hypothetical protein
VQPTRKRITAPTRTAASFLTLFPDMTSLSNNLHYPHHAEPQQMMAQVR